MEHHKITTIRSARFVNLNNDTFSGEPVISAQCIIETENYPDACILIKCDNDDYSQGYGQIKENFKGLAELISLNHIYVIMISDLPMSGLMLLVIIYMFSI